MMIRVLLVDDHELMREGLRSILEREDDVEVVGEASSGRDGASSSRARSRRTWWSWTWR